MKTPGDLPTSKSRSRQLSFGGGFIPRLIHGGSESRGKRKLSRPFTPKASMHIVLKSKRARGTWSLRHRRNEAEVTRMVYVYAARFNVRIYEFANGGNHLHILAKSRDRKAMADFLRTLAGRIAVTVSGAQRRVKRVGRFWDHLCWSRVVKPGKPFQIVRRYVFANVLEPYSKTYREMALKNPYLLLDPEFG